MPARPCADRAPTGSSITLVDRVDAEHHDDAGHEADHHRRPGDHVARPGGDRNERRDRAVAGHADVDRLGPPVRGGDRGNHAARRGQVGDDQDLGEAAVDGVERRARVEPEPAQPQDEDAQAEQRHVVAGDRSRLALHRVFAAPWAEVQHGRQRAGGTDEVHRGRAGEVLHADVGLQPAAAEDPAGGDRIDHRREDHGVDDVDAELDPLERRAPDDRQRDRAEDELEPELGLDRGVREAHDRERRQRIAVVAQEEPVRPDDVAEAPAEGKGETDRPVHDRSDREVGQDLGDNRSGVLAAGEPDL